MATTIQANGPQGQLSKKLDVQVEAVAVDSETSETSAPKMTAAGIATTPEDHILSLAWASADSANVGVIVRLGIAEHVPLDQATISSRDLAAACNIAESLLTRIVRYAICNGVFAEPEPYQFAHTPASRALAQSKHLRDAVELSTFEIASILAKLPEALGRQRDDKTGSAPAAAFNLAYPQSPDVFDYFAKDAEAASRYHRYLDGRVNTPRWSVDHLVSAWDWASIGSGTLIDLGGSSGHTCRALARVCPEAKFIVQDFSDEAIAMGKSVVEADEQLKGRIEFVKHDFFQPETLQADVYVIRHILHDWSDEDSIKILRNLVPALRDGARVLISEGILPDRAASQAKSLDDKQVRIEDAFMLAVHNATERSVADFERLFQAADSRFELVGVTGGGAGAFQSLLEFRFAAGGDDVEGSGEGGKRCACVSCRD